MGNKGNFILLVFKEYIFNNPVYLLVFRLFKSIFISMGTKKPKSILLKNLVLDRNRNTPHLI